MTSVAEFHALALPAGLFFFHLILPDRQPPPTLSVPAFAAGDHVPPAIPPRKRCDARRCE